MAVASSSSASVAVEKATSDLLIEPDWTMNIDICDSLNSNHWLAKDVMKAVKKRLQHKNPKVQLLALTLLETMVKNCGDYVHFQIAEKNILGEMIRIVKKKTDMHVRDKILILLDAWQEAFGGPGGKHPQYYWAYEELRRSGVEFPQRSPDAAPIFTPPVTHSALGHAQAGFGMPSNSSRRLDETMATEIEGLSLSTLDSTRNVMELLGDMLQAVSPDDREAVKDEIIVDLVYRCRSNQKKLMQMLTTTGDEELLGQGLELNDSLQLLLAKHDAIASGHPMPAQVTDFSPKPSEGSSSNINQTEVKRTTVKDIGSSPSTIATASVTTTTRSHIDEEDDEEDDFAQLARRHSKPQSSPSQASDSSSRALVPVDTSNAISSANVSTSIVLALPDPPAPVRTTKEQDIIDLLSITLSTTSTPHHPQTPTTPPNPSMPQVPVSNQSMPQGPASSSQGYSYFPQAYPGNQGQAGYSNYVVPWAQPQTQQQLQFPSQHQLQPQQRLQPQSQIQPQTVSQPNSHLQTQPQPHKQYSQQPQSQLYSQPQQQFTQSQSQPYSQPQPQFPQSHSQPYSQPQPQAQQFQSQSQSQTYSHPQPQPQPQQFQTESQSQPYSQPQPQQFQTRSQSQPYSQQQPQQFQTQSQPRVQAQPPSRQQFQSQQSTDYIPPPWAVTPGYANGHTTTTSNMFPTPQSNADTSYAPAQASKSLPQDNSFNSRGSNGLAMNGNPRASSGPRNTATSGQKPFILSYRLFEDLNVLGNADGRFKMNGSTAPSLSGPPSQGIVGGRK